MTVLINLYQNQLEIEVTGSFTEGEPDVGLPDSFEIQTINLTKGQVFDLIEWTEAQHGDALTKINERCVEAARDLLNSK